MLQPGLFPFCLAIGGRAQRTTWVRIAIWAERRVALTSDNAPGFTHLEYALNNVKWGSKHFIWVACQTDQQPRDLPANIWFRHDSRPGINLDRSQSQLYSTDIESAYWELRARIGGFLCRSKPSQLSPSSLRAFRVLCTNWVLRATTAGQSSLQPARVCCPWLPSAHAQSLGVTHFLQLETADPSLLLRAGEWHVPRFVHWTSLLSASICISALFVLRSKFKVLARFKIYRRCSIPITLGLFEWRVFLWGAYAISTAHPVAPIRGVTLTSNNTSVHAQSKHVVSPNTLCA